MALEELKIQQKVYDMIFYGNKCLIQYPKSERYALATEIKKSMYNLLELIIVANKKYYKKTTLQEIDVTLDVLRTMIRLSMDLQYLPIRKYEIWSKMLNEIGKMLGGWMKAMKK